MKTICSILLILLGCSVAHEAKGQPSIDDCGYLVTVGPCLMFHSVGDGMDYFLDDYGDFQERDVVRVTGEFTVLDGRCGSGHTYGHVLSNTITRCERLDLGCVVYSVAPSWDDGHVTGFWHPDYGNFSFRNSRFASGDSIHVWGTPDCTVLPVCCFSCVLLQPRVVVCGDTLTSVNPTSWGRLKALYR